MIKTFQKYFKGSTKVSSINKRGYIIKGGVRQNYIDINKKQCFHVLNTWRMYYEYSSTTKQLITIIMITFYY